jgi:UDP-N-acetylglucosamine transferase subunit ALG13
MTGTHDQGFDRLIKAVDELAKNYRERIFVQTGNSTIKPKNCEWKKFLNGSEREQKIKQSSLIITHGGSGSIIDSLRNGKKTVVVPREKRFNEHSNDHQFDLAEALHKQKKVIMCTDVDNLSEAIEQAKKTIILQKKGNNGIAKEIELFLGK